MPKAKLQHLAETIGLLAYDIEKSKFVWPKSNKEYIELYMNLYQQQAPKKEAKLLKDSLKSKARLALAENYIAIYKFSAARKQYSKLIEANKLDEGYLGLATVAYAEQLYYEVLLHTQRIHTHTSTSYLLEAKAYFELQQYDYVFEPLEKAFELDPYNHDVLLLRALFYEQLYRNELQEPSYIIRAIASYQILFEKHILEKRRHTDKLVYEPWHLQLTKYVTLLLEVDMAYEAIDLLTQYFNLLPMVGEKKLTELLQQVFVLELKNPVYEFATPEQLSQLEKQLKSEWLNAYQLQASLLLELFAYAYLINGDLEKAIEQLQIAKKFRSVTSVAATLLKRLQGLRKIQRHDIQFHPDDYITKCKQLEWQFHYEYQQLILPIIQNVLQHTQLTSLEAAQLSLKHVIVHNLYPLWIEKTLGELAPVFSLIEQLEKAYNARMIQCLRSKVPFSNLQPLAQRPVMLPLLHDVERYFKQYEQPPELLQDFIFESYCSIFEQLLAKAIGEAFTHELLIEEDTQYKIGTIPYYAKTTNKQQLAFLQKRIDATELQKAISQLFSMRTKKTVAVRKQFYKTAQLLFEVLPV